MKALVLKIVLVTAGFLCLGFNSYAQIEEGTEIRSSVELEKEVVEDVELGAGVGYRFIDGLSSFESILGEFGIKFKIKKDFKLSFDYRVTKEPDITKNRGSVSFGWSDKILKRTELSWRAKYQRDYEKNELPRVRLRNKVELKHRIKKTDIEPYIGGESFYTFHFEGNFFSRTRFILGSDFKLSKRSDVSIEFMRQWDYNSGTPSNINIVAVGYSLEIK